VRPRCARREIFLTLKAPFRRLSQRALYHLVSTRLGALGIQVPRRGPHSLRHACAGHLQAEGFSLKAIGDHLGHRSAYATRIYAKVDLVGLREVANFDLGGLR
jgi:site-specific recombinase XerD